mmetsp:Transcript_3696/g.7468  ORF Transcript_3696/g.7468 Transcript_3696/m.7468 type:complete len:224 (+) Transcript_3696:308-979(+)
MPIMYGIGAHATFTIEGVRVGMNTCSQHSEATLNIEEAEKTHDVKSGKLEEWKISLRSLSIADRTLSVSGVPRVRSNGSIPPPIPPTLPFEPALGSVEILWLQSDLIDSLVSLPCSNPFTTTPLIGIGTFLYPSEYLLLTSSRTLPTTFWMCNLYPSISSLYVISAFLSIPSIILSKPPTHPILHPQSTSHLTKITMPLVRVSFTLSTLQRRRPCLTLTKGYP